MIPTDLVRGDVVQITWVDIYEDVTGDPDHAQLARRVSIGIYWGTAISHGVASLVTTSTLDVGLKGQNGFCIYPVACVVEIKIVKRVRRPRARRPPAGSVTETPDPSS